MVVKTQQLAPSLHDSNSMQPAFHDVVQNRNVANFVWVVADDAEAMALEEGARCNGDLGVETDQTGPSRLLENLLHDCQHVPLASMLWGYIGAVDVAVSIEFDKARHIAIHNCNPRLLAILQRSGFAIASPTPFLNPRITTLMGVAQALRCSSV